MPKQESNQDGVSEHIGTGNHSKRNLLLGGAVVAAAVVIGLFYAKGDKSNDDSIAQLTKFRTAMVTQCKDDQFAKPVQKGLNDLYASSSRMQGVVTEQLGSLSRGSPNCPQILKALKSVDYPVD